MGDSNRRSAGDESRHRVDRRAVLRGLSTTAVVGGLAGCSDVIQPEYEATPVEMPEDRAAFLGYDPKPTARSSTVGETAGSGTNAVNIGRMTSHSRQWTYRSALAIEPSGDDGGMADILPNCDSGVDGGLGGPGLGTGGDDDTDFPVDDSFTVRSIPDPDIGGVDINPVANSSMEDLIRERPGAFEQLCDCELDTGSVSVEQATLNDMYGPGDVDQTVYAIEGHDELGVPKEVSLMGEDRPVRAFVFGVSSDVGGVVMHFVLGAKRHYQPETGGSDVVHAAYVGRFHWDSLGRSRPVFGPDGLFVENVAEAYADRLSFACPCLAEAPEKRLAGQRQGKSAMQASPSTRSRRSADAIAQERPSFDSERLSASQADELWETARNSAQTETIRTVAADSFEVEIDGTNVAGWKHTTDGTDTYVLLLPFGVAEHQDIYNVFYIATFDADKQFEGAGFTATMPIERSEVLVQSFAPVDGDRHDFYSTVRRGRIMNYKRRIGSTSTTLRTDVRQEAQFDRTDSARSIRQATDGTSFHSVSIPGGDQRDVYASVQRPSGGASGAHPKPSPSVTADHLRLDGQPAASVDWEETLEVLGCVFCNAAITIIVDLLKDAVCNAALYTKAYGAVSGVQGNPASGMAGLALAKALCNQLMSKSEDWLIDTTYCCLCHEIGLCETDHCEELEDNGVISNCGCCSCDDSGSGSDDDTGGSSGGGFSGGTGTMW